MKQRPIIFSAPMVKAILEGRKTQTRRIMRMDRNNDHVVGFSNDPDVPWPADYGFGVLMGRAYYDNEVIKCPYGRLGDLLYVKETYGELYDYCDHPEMPGCPTERWSLGYVYRATDTIEIKNSAVYVNGEWNFAGIDYWKPSIFMPKSAARIFLEITDIKVERVNEISEQDAIAEGILQDEIGYKDYDKERAKEYGHPDYDYPHVQHARLSFKSLWISINGEESWDSNPWVWAITFKVLSTTGIEG